VPLEVDLRAQARTLRLKLDPLDKTLALDLRRDTDRARSVLLHRLTALGIDWGEVTEDAVRGTGTFHETWSLRWRPEFAVAVVDAARWGTTVQAAATAKVADLARRAGDLAGVTAAVEIVLLADLADALPDVLAALDARAALDADVVHLMAAVPALVRAVRYGDVRGTDTAALAAVVDALVVRVCAALPAAVGSLADDAAAVLRRHVDAMQGAVTLYAQAEAGQPGRDRWLTTLSQLAERRDVHGLLAGRITRLLLDAGRLERSAAAVRFGAHLSVGVGALDKAAWAEGFLAGGGLLLVHDPELLTVLDEWLASLGPDDFVDVLPLLRRTFGTYSPPERAHIGEAVRHLGRGTAPSPGRDEELDEERAARVLVTVASILRGR